MEKKIFKVVLLGDPAVGKTSLIFRYVEDRFEDNYLSTLGFDLSMKTVKNPKGEYILSLWDIAGNEQFDSLRSSYLDGANGAVLVYDATRLETFNNIFYWYEICTEIAGYIPIVLVGNKMDLVDEIEVDREKVRKLLPVLETSDVFETSAKTGYEVKTVFEKIFGKIYEAVSLVI